MIMRPQLPALKKRDGMKAVGRDGTKAISGHKEGRDEGAQLKAIEIATKMLSKGIMPAEIAEVTGLSEAEIDAIRQRLQ